MNQRRSGVLWALAITALAAVAAEDPATLAGFEGSWVRTLVDRDDEAREAEIERVTETMSVLTRGVARSLMSRRMRPHASLRIACDGDGLVVRSGEEGRPRKSNGE